MAKRAIIRLELDVAIKEALDELCERRGMTQITVLSRLVAWFDTQDTGIQSAILDLAPEQHLGPSGEVLLKRLAAKARGRAGKERADPRAGPVRDAET